MTIDIRTRHQFLEEYRHIRHAEGRGSNDAAYYQALPYADLSGRNSSMWEMRARTYDFLRYRILPSLERAVGRPLDILDLGAGNCWMSYRLSLCEHRPVALDIFNDERDGLRAVRHYPKRLPVIEGDFDQLPFGNETFDVAIYNSSFHYSTDYVGTLAEARRCLRGAGTVLILDSPIYRRPEHGERMVRERHTEFERRYGFRSDAVPSIEFLDKPMLGKLRNDLGIEWRIYRPWYGWRWHTRPYKAWVARKRPPSRFWILAGTFQKR